MKLTTDLNIKIYEVLADYKVKVSDSPFIAILKFADENGGQIDSTMLYQNLLYPLSEKACENILDRLAVMGYFDKNVEDDYSLNQNGYRSAEQEIFFDNKHGILKIYIADNEFVKQKLVKIEEIYRQDTFEEKYLKSLRTTDLHELQNPNQDIELENGTFIINKFEEKCRPFETEKKQLIIQTSEKDSIIKVMDFTYVIDRNFKKVRNEVIKNEFGRNYLEKEQVLKMDFNPNSLELQRTIKVQKPRISSTTFNQVEIQSIKLSPQNSVDANEWFKALVAQNVNKYFLSETEFVEFENRIALEFKLYSTELEDSLSKEDVIQELDKEKGFYKKAMLETIDYLNY